MPQTSIDTFPNTAVQDLTWRDTARDTLEILAARAARIAAPVLLVAVALTACGDSNNTDYLGKSDAEAAASGETPTTAAECMPTWKTERITSPGNPKWDPNGSKYIEDAHNAALPEEERKAAQLAATDWLATIKKDPKVFFGALRYFKNAPGLEEAKDVTVDELSDGNCASAKAAQLATQFELFIAGHPAKADLAPARGVNSGVDANGNVVRSKKAGVKGDRQAIRIDFTNEKGEACSVWILKRCKQIVVLQSCVPTEIPIGKTDDDILPGDGTPRSQDSGTPDVAGSGPAGQTPKSFGFAPGDSSSSSEDLQEKDRDNDGDGITNGADACDDAKETANGYQDDDGCPDERPTATTAAPGETTPTTGPPQEDREPTPVTTTTTPPNDQPTPTPNP
jgi:hypothetical protein